MAKLLPKMYLVNATVTIPVAVLAFNDKAAQKYARRILADESGLLRKAALTASPLATKAALKLPKDVLFETSTSEEMAVSQNPTDATYLFDVREAAKSLAAKEAEVTKSKSKKKGKK